MRKMNRVNASPRVRVGHKGGGTWEAQSRTAGEASAQRAGSHPPRSAGRNLKRKALGRERAGPAEAPSLEWVIKGWASNRRGGGARWLCTDCGVRGRADAGGHSDSGGDDSGLEQ